jgi:class 3 adenylate cyclase
VPRCARCGFESETAFRFCPECGGVAIAATIAHEQRKTVTVLFCDLAGSTALGERLDPERLRALLARYFDRMQAIVRRHGGTVEKFVGDAVMAVFGVPVLHEDDALRAVRAAVEMRDALPDLGLQGRIGVMTGEVVTGTDERLVTGDAVNVAARLEQTAKPGEVLIGQPTLALVREAVDVETVEPLDLKGKSAPVPAYRLQRVREAARQRDAGAFVGRVDELAQLRSAWEHALSEQRCVLETVVGDAGIGKSRLAEEFLASVGATVLRGRCPPYGEGITYWPVVAVLKQLGLVPSDDAAAAAIRSLLGETTASTSAEEIAWAFRKTLELAASRQPLVVVFDDIQWGEETFLDLVEHVALLSSGPAIMLLCLARPELGERRPAWPLTVRLHPLGDEEVDDLISERVTDDLRGKISRAAGGNPLFVEEMLAMADEAQGEISVPPTLHALLAARIDQLEPAERRVLESGAVEGEVFHRGAVQALVPTETQVTPRLAALVRKELIRPDTPQLRGEDGFRFRHLLIRDAAYDALPKNARAELHVRFATWLEQHGADLVELDEILGYHLEQAYAYRAELGLDDDDQLATAARRRLGAGGRRATVRRDFGAAANLLERAVALIPPTQIDVALELELARALNEAGRGAAALKRSESLGERGVALGDRVAELCGRLQAGIIRTNLEPEGSIEKLDALVAQALPVLHASGNDLALYTACHAQGWVAFTRARTDAAMQAFDLAGAHARRAGIPDELIGWRALSRLYGTTPVSDLLAWLDENEPREGRDYWLRASRAVALAMTGRFDEARAILAETREELAERGGDLQLAIITGIESVVAELLAGDPGAAAELGAEGCRRLEELDAQAFLSTAAAELAEALYLLDRLEEAAVWADRAAELGADDDMFTELSWRRTKAKLLSRRGDHPGAERLAREAVAIGEATDDLTWQGEAYAGLGEVLLLAGRTDEPAAALEQALERFERKENRVGAERVRARLGELMTADSRAMRP